MRLLKFGSVLLKLLTGFLPEGKLKSFWLLLMFLYIERVHSSHPQVSKIKDLGGLYPVACIVLTRLFCLETRAQCRVVGEHFVLGQIRA